MVPRDCLTKLYFAFVFPYLNYGVEIYANCCKECLDKLNKLNNKLLRIILGKTITTPNIDLYRLLNVLPIPLLHEYTLLELIHKFHYHKYLLPEIFQNYFTPKDSIHHYRTRNRCNLFMPTVNSATGQRSSLFRGSTFWNDLP